MTLDEMTAHYDALFEAQAETNPAAQTLEFWKDHFTTRCARLLSGCETVIDVGGSWGAIGAWVTDRADKTWCVVEPSKAAIEFGEARVPINVGFWHGAFPDHVEALMDVHLPFHAAFLGQVLEHVEDPDAVLRAVRRVLVPYAPVVVVVPLGTHHWDPDHKREFSHFTLEGLCGRHGVGVRSWTNPEGTQLAASFQAFPEVG